MTKKGKTDSLVKPPRRARTYYGKLCLKAEKEGVVGYRRVGFEFSCDIGSELLEEENLYGSGKYHFLMDLLSTSDREGLSSRQTTSPPAVRRLSAPSALRSAGRFAVLLPEIPASDSTPISSSPCASQ